MVVFLRIKSVDENQKWYEPLDVELRCNQMEIKITKVKMGPCLAANGNEYIKIYKYTRFLVKGCQQTQ